METNNENNRNIINSTRYIKGTSDSKIYFEVKIIPRENNPIRLKTY